MTSIWHVTHWRSDRFESWPAEDEKDLGFFETQDEVDAAVAAARALPGFRDYPDGFHIEHLELDEFVFRHGFSIESDAEIARARTMGIDRWVGPLPGDLRWYGVRTAYRFSEDMVEERVTLWLATTDEEAIALAEAEAREYVEGMSMTYLGHPEAFATFIANVPIKPGMEVFSSLGEVGLPPGQYLKKIIRDAESERRFD